MWGVNTKCLFQDDRGFKIWGGFIGNRGDKLSFVARVQVSEKDAKFGFFKRPTKIVELD